MTPIIRTPAPAQGLRRLAPSASLVLILVGILVTAHRAVRHEDLATSPLIASQPVAVASSERHSIDIARIGERTTDLRGGVTSLNAPMTSAVSISGWVVDAAAKRPALKVEAVVNGRTFQAVAVDRPDVAAALGASSYFHSGFTLTVPAGSLPPGHWELTLDALSADGRTSYDLQPGLTLYVTP